MGNGILTMVVGAIIMVAGMHHADPAATLAGTVVYVGGLHFPRPLRRRTEDRRHGGRW